MSIDYSAQVAYGLFVEADIIKKMMTEFPLKTEKQERFDHFTGKSLGKIDAIVQPRHHALVLGKEKFGFGEECNDSLEAGLEQLAHSVNRRFSCFRCQEQDGTVYAYVFGIGINDLEAQTLAKHVALVEKNTSKMLKVLNKLLPKGTTLAVKPTATAILEVC